VAVAIVERSVIVVERLKKGRKYGTSAGTKKVAIVEK